MEKRNTASSSHGEAAVICIPRYNDAEFMLFFTLPGRFYPVNPVFSSYFVEKKSWCLLVCTEQQLTHFWLVVIFSFQFWAS